MAPIQGDFIFLFDPLKLFLTVVSSQSKDRHLISSRINQTEMTIKISNSVTAPRELSDVTLASKDESDSAAHNTIVASSSSEFKSGDSNDVDKK